LRWRVAAVIQGRKVRLVPRAKPVRPVLLVQQVLRARLADKVPPDLVASAALPDRKDQLAQPVLPALPARRAIPDPRPRFASSRERIA